MLEKLYFGFVAGGAALIGLLIVLALTKGV